MHMDLQKINIKFFFTNTVAIPSSVFIRIFNSWIQDSDGDYHDVADYGHLHSGPGVFLLAHEANISIDNTAGRAGLLYNRKQPIPGTNHEKLRASFRSALETCRRIEGEPSLGGRFRFRGNEAFFLINDRLLAPNTEETFQAIKPDLGDLAGTLFAGADFSLDHQNDPRERFAVRVKSPVDFDITSLLHNLQ